ncbi:MAG: NFACT family protein, partial [Clostridiales bacterium]
MPYDSLVMAAAATEINALTGARVMKVYQPDRFGITLKLHALEGNCQLLLSAHPVTGRAHLTTQARENPGNPPLFCMVLRKHLEGGRLIKVEQLGWERVLHLSFQITDETGMPGLRDLYLEIMGKHSNLVLVHPTDHLIIDGIRRYSHNVSRHREVLP